MKKEEIAIGIFLYSDVIENNHLIINDIEDVISSGIAKWNPAAVSGYQDKKIRDTDTISIRYLEQLDYNFNNPYEAFLKNMSNIFLKSFSPIKNDYMKYYNIDLQNHYDYEILKYSKNQTFLNHIDDHPNWPRRVSLVHYFNHDYVGGEISFPRFNLEIKPTANQALIFPSNYVYNHSVNPVLEGIKYSLATWIS